MFLNTPDLTLNDSNQGAALAQLRDHNDWVRSVRELDDARSARVPRVGRGADEGRKGVGVRASARTRRGLADMRVSR